MTATTTPPATAAPAAPAADQEGGLTHRQIVLILIGLMSGMFLAALDQTIVATAIRVIGDDLNGLSAQAWVTTAYLITSTITTPLYGKLSDMYGRRPFFLIAIAIFIIGSVASAFSTSMYMLAGFRAVQGLGAGGLFSLALTILGDIVPPRQRAKYQGYFLAVFGTSSVLGPVIGGFFAGQGSILGISGWRWVFLVNVPIGIAALLIVYRVLHIPHTSREHRVDWQGAVALVVALVPLLTVAEQGRTWGWFDVKSIVGYVVSVIGIVLFLLFERRAGEDALIPLRMFRNGTFRVVTSVNVLVGAGMFGGLALLPLYLQIVKGRTPTESGLLLLPLTAGIMVGSIVSGQITSRTGKYKVFPIIGTAAMTVAFFLMWWRINADTSLVVLDLLMALFGYGLGNIMQSTVLAIQNASAPREIGVATSSVTFFRQIGATLGTAVFLSLLYTTVAGNILGRYRTALTDPSFRQVVGDPTTQANPANRTLLGIARAAGGGAIPSGTRSSALNDTSFLKTATSRLAHPYFQGFADSMSLVFLIGGLVLLVAFGLVWFLKETPLRTQSGIEAARSEASSGTAMAPATVPTDDIPLDRSGAPAEGSTGDPDGSGPDGVDATRPAGGDRVPTRAVDGTADGFRPRHRRDLDPLSGVGPGADQGDGTGVDGPSRTEGAEGELTGAR